MKPTIDFNAEATRFQKMLREWLATTSRELAAAINARIEEHLDAGADQVCIQALGRDGKADEAALKALVKA